MEKSGSIARIQDHLEELNDIEQRQKNCKILIPYNPNALIPKGESHFFNVGYFNRFIMNFAPILYAAIFPKYKRSGLACIFIG